MKDNNKYCKVYFRIESGYVWGKGLPEENYTKIEKELVEIFEPLGFILKPDRTSSSSPEYQRGAESLYCHPQSFSGYIQIDSIHPIESLLKKAKSFSLRKTDIYETVYNYTQDELVSELKNQEAVVREDILSLFKTKRRNLYKPKSQLDNVKVNISCFDNRYNHNPVVTKFIYSTFSKLLEEKQIIESENYKVGKIYRTAS